MFTDSVEIGDCLTYYIQKRLHTCTWDIRAVTTLQHHLVEWVQYSRAVHHILQDVTISISTDSVLVSDQYILIQEVLGIQTEDLLLQWMSLCAQTYIQLIGLKALLVHTSTDLSGCLGTITISYDALVHCCHRLMLVCREHPVLENCTRALLNLHFVQVETIVRTQRNAARLLVHQRSRDVKWMAYLARLQTITVPAVWNFAPDTISNTDHHCKCSTTIISTEVGEWVFQSPASILCTGTHQWLTLPSEPTHVQQQQQRTWSTVCQSGYILVPPGSQVHLTLPPTSETRINIVRVYIGANAELWLHGGNYGGSSTIDISLMVFGTNAHVHFCPHNVHEIFVHHHRRPWSDTTLRTWERTQLNHSVCVLGQDSIPDSGYPTTIDSVYKDLTMTLESHRQSLRSCTQDADRTQIQAQILAVEMELESLYGLNKRVTTIGTMFFLHSTNN